MAVLLVLAIGGAFAVADESEETVGAGTSLSEIQAGPVTTEPAIADELPHTDLGRDEILALIGGVFENTLEGTAGPFDDLVVEEFLSSHAAVISAEQSPEPAGLVVGEATQESTRPLLFESSIPLKRDGEVLDLSLERDEGIVEATNPLVDVDIPAELGEGVGLSEADLGISLPGAAEDRTPSILNESTALYPNVAPNTDFIVAPAPKGLETFTVLRDANAAAGEQELDLEFPAGGELIENADGSATVVVDGQARVQISAPSAIDADGQPVAASMNVDGSSIFLSVEPTKDTSWPVLVDPMFETYQWEGTSLSGCGEFRYLGGPNAESNSPFSWICGTVVTGATTKRGLATKAVPGSFHSGQFVQIAHEVPRLKQDEEAGINTGSFFAGMTLSNVNIGTSGGSASPFALTGIWDTSTNNWAGLAPSQAAWGYPGNGAIVSNATISMTSGNASGAKLAVPTSLMVNEGTATSTGAGRSFSVGTASFEIADIQNPEVLNPSASTKWVNGTAKEPVEITVKDYGLGAKRAKFTAPGQATVQIDNSCSGTVATPCPPVWVAKLGTSQYNPGLMFQGENMVKVVGEDAIGQQSPTAKALVLVDHSAPDTTTGGTLAEQAKVGTGLGQYTLNYTAKDGDDAPAAALIPWGTAGKAEKQLERPMGVAVAADGSVYAVDRLNNRVIKYDTEGKAVLQFGSSGSGDALLSDPRGIDIAPDGTVWVADMGNDSIKAFSPSGTFLRKARFTDSASEPYAIASGPGGVLWVTDIGLKRVVKLSENPLSTLLITTGKSGCPGKCVGTAVISPTGVATDKSGNVWIADGGLGKVLELDSSGIWKFEFGTGGAGDGQIDGIVGIDVSPAGNIAITERNNGRVQLFRTDGSYLRKFGSIGSAANQFSEAGGLSFGPDNTLVVADAGNKRVARWSHADQDPQSGTAKVEVKMDGTVVQSKTQSCTSGIPNVPGKNCSISGSWTLDADDYAGGAHKVEVIATDTVGISSTKTLDIETHGDHTDPAIILSGSMTQQTSIGTTRPSYKLKAVATDPGPDEELKSGIASTVIKVDGAVVDSTSPGCPAGGCSITREWSLNSANYAVGTHTVEVKATDASGRVGTKSLELNIARDTTAPEFGSLPEFYTAPSGWLEQKSFHLGALATDEGYGVTAMQLRIDGNEIKATSQACAEGGCSKWLALGQFLNTAGYSGGAHPAELIATDGAGNTRKRKWTMNIAPAGEIPPQEATDTLEAMEETVPGNQEFLPVASTPEYLEPEIIEAGDNPHFEESAGKFRATGIPVDATFDPSTETLTVEGTEGSLALSPVISTQAPEIASGAALVLPSKQVGANTVIRPEYNGAQMFTTICDASAPEVYEWRLQLHFGQYLVQANPQQVEVKWGNGETAFLVSAEPAHDALGKELPTTLSIINGTDIALTVPHKNQGYTYPVSAGKSLETGYATVSVFIPEEAEEAEQEEEDAEEAADPITFEELTELNGELASMTQYKGSGQHRDPNKPIKKRQARKLIHVKQNGRKVGPPASASNGPGNGDASKIFGLQGGTCSKGNCDVWQIEFDEGTFARGSNWAAVNPGGDPQNWACSHHVDDWWTWNIDMDLGPDGVDKPTLVYKGEGKHLTYWCEYNVEIYPLPELYSMGQDQVIEDWVYPNGYQVTHGSGARGIQIFQN